MKIWSLFSGKGRLLPPFGWAVVSWSKVAPTHFRWGMQRCRLQPPLHPISEHHLPGSSGLFTLQAPKESCCLPGPLKQSISKELHVSLRHFLRII